MVNKKTITGFVFDIQQFSLHDGPGIRTTVFLKGCSLRCFWCQNPEGLTVKSELQFFATRCIGCGSCFRVCTNKVHIIENGKHIIKRERCMQCGKCVDECFARALIMVGKEMTSDEVVKVVIQDKMFYSLSGGGVTLSGGEPVLQSEFAYEILKKCKNNNIHTAIETALNFKWDNIKVLLSVLDIVIMDIKHIDSKKHQEATGVSNKLILENAKRLSKEKIPIIIRVPVIPLFNDNVGDIKKITDFAKDFPNLLYIELLPFHRLGESKYETLGLFCNTKKSIAPDKTKMLKFANIVRNVGIRVKG
ncbi:MAG: glycyl-radical enzyme activating protein [Candidatus Firestonebacteria bacterium]